MPWATGYPKRYRTVLAHLPKYLITMYWFTKVTPPTLHSRSRPLSLHATARVGGRQVGGQQTDGLLGRVAPRRAGAGVQERAGAHNPPGNTRQAERLPPAHLTGERRGVSSMPKIESCCSVVLRQAQGVGGARPVHNSSARGHR